MGLESDAAWLRHEAKQHFARLDEVAREIQSPRRTNAQKSGYVALMASDLCGVLSEIRQRGVFKELARGVERELSEGKVSIELNRSDLAKIVTS